MATNGFSVRVYGNLNEQPPYVADVNGGLSALQATYTAAQSLVANFPSSTVNLWPISPGVKMNGGVFCYGVIEVPASGLQQFSQKYVVQQTVNALVSLRNA